MASLNDYKKQIQVLKMEQKIGRIQNELETVDYGDECPLHGENDCAEVRKAYDRGYVSGLYEALTLFKLIEADTPQTETQNSNKNSNVILVSDGVSEMIRCAICNNPNQSHKGCDGACSYDEKLYKRIMDAIDESRVDTPQTDCNHKCIQTEVGCERTDCPWK